MRIKKAVIGITAGLAAITVGGAAYAMWSANGSGSANSKALSAQTVTVNAVTGTADLYPGFTGGDAYFNFTNSNPYPVTFTAMTAGTVTSSNPSGCPASHLTVANATGLNLTVAANTTSGTQSIPDVVTLASAAPDGCQGVTFSIAMTLTGSQV